MGRSVSPVLRQELANLDKDADSRRSAIKVLKSYAKDLDSKAIPRFLAEVTDTKGAAGVPAGECTISLYEVLARVHGRSIVPQIDNIMSTIMCTLSSSGGSFPLHQACSKVVPAIARYGIDPSTPDEEKTRIICSLCKPLSDVLMGSQEGTASGAALCLKALVDSGNWRFASDEMVNEVCLKVAGALEEKLTQTNAHMGLVMSLVKHNGVIAEAYSRSLVRSGLQILATGAAESNSQKRFSAIQMINFLMKCVDPRSISSEVFNIVDAMEKCQADDKMPFVRGAAFEALQTAKSLAAQEGSRYELGASPVVNPSFRRRNEKSPWRNRSPVPFCSPESQTVDSCIKKDTFAESPASVAQPSCGFERGRRASRRLWNHDGCPAVDVSLKDGLFLRACSGSDGKDIDVKLSDPNKERAEDFSGFTQESETAMAVDAFASPQKSIPQPAIDDIRIQSTPAKPIRSLQSGAFSSESQSQKVNSENPGTTAGKLNDLKDDEKDGLESVSSTDDVPESGICEELHGTTDPGVKNAVPPLKSRNRIGYGTAALGFLWAGLAVLLAIIFSSMEAANDELGFGLVPT
ncbi:hypothetical protein GW17_00041662 [Ensete ventricosum]|nr:hypothetical protein GW17_00041662 [Ensete ventricosum]